MTCCAENNFEKYKNYDTPSIAGNTRFMLGVTLTFIGLYIALFSGIQGHGLGFLLVFFSPFVIFTDDE
ncbi:MAG: hypothetical protein ABI891_05110 [Acidobacteriota bacterium]